MNRNEQIEIFDDVKDIDVTDLKALSKSKINKLDPADKKIHDWYRFVLSFPPHLVRHYLKRFELKKGQILLDPFCGTGTTVVEARIHGLHVIGVEANPFAHFASKTKTTWDIDPIALLRTAEKIADNARDKFSKEGISDDLISKAPKRIQMYNLSTELEKLLLKDSISPLPLMKLMILLDEISKYSGEKYYNHLLLALGKALVFKISNLKFGPEVGLGEIKKDAAVLKAWFDEVWAISHDLQSLRDPEKYASATIILNDSRNIKQFLQSNSIDGVITSPPYPNEKDYTRTTRLESVLLGFIKSKKELQDSKKTLIRSNTRGVYKNDDDDMYIERFPEIMKLADQIEKRRIELGKDSGFERMYARVTKLYFGGMYKHFSEMTNVLKPGAKLAYVVGDQASYFRIKIRTGELLASIAESLGYRIINIDLFRTRFATATGDQLREEVLLLEWNPNGGKP